MKKRQGRNKRLRSGTRDWNELNNVELNKKGVIQMREKALRAQ